jgi:hypothetical protein
MAGIMRICVGLLGPKCENIVLTGFSNFFEASKKPGRAFCVSDIPPFNLG